MWSVARLHLLLLLSYVASQSLVFYDNLPDGMNEVLVSHYGGLLITGFDSRRRVCLVLFAPPFGRPLRTVAELPYRDFGRYTPSVLAAHDPARAEFIYVLLYLHPDNLGLEQMSLYRVDVASGKQVLLSAVASPAWTPTALIPRRDASVLVALSGLGPMLVYGHCNATACKDPTPLNSTASFTSGKHGVVQIDESGRLCLVVRESIILGQGGRLVCEADGGALVGIVSHHDNSDGNEFHREHSHERNSSSSSNDKAGGGSSSGSSSGGLSGGESDDSMEDDCTTMSCDEPSKWADNDHDDSGVGNIDGEGGSSSGGGGDRPRNATSVVSSPDPMLINPSSITSSTMDKASGRVTLFVVARDGVNEQGFSQGSVFAIERREPLRGEACGANGGVGCWESPRLVVRSVSNPTGLVVDEQTGTLYVVEQNTVSSMRVRCRYRLRGPLARRQPPPPLCLPPSTSFSFPSPADPPRPLSVFSRCPPSTQLRGYSYSTFHGDVLAFCAKGSYDCTGAQNSGECVCAAGYGGPCCEIDLRPNFMGAAILATAASQVPAIISMLGALALLLWIYTLVRSADKGPPSVPPPRDAQSRSRSVSGDGAAAVTLWRSESSSDSGNGSPLLCDEDENEDGQEAKAQLTSDEARHRGGDGGSGRAAQRPAWLDDLQVPLCSSRVGPEAGSAAGGGYLPRFDYGGSNFEEMGTGAMGAMGGGALQPFGGMPAWCGEPMAPVAGYLPGGRGAGSGGGGGIGRPYMPPSSASVSSHASSGQRPCASSSSPTNPRVACSSTPPAALRNSNHPSAQPGHVSCRTFSLPEPILPADDALRSLLDDALLPSADQLYGSPDPMGSYSGEGTPFSRSYSETDASRAQASGLSPSLLPDVYDFSGDAVSPELRSIEARRPMSDPRPTTRAGPRPGSRPASRPISRDASGL